MKPPKKVVVVVDTREKYPLLFPSKFRYWPGVTSRKKPHLIKVETKKLALPIGDYLLEGFEDARVVERKGSVPELASNFLAGDDRRRAKAAFSRLVKGCRKPTLLLDFQVTQLYTKYKGPEGLLPSVFFREIEDLGVDLVFGGRCKVAASRRYLGLVVLHMLLETAIGEGK